MNLDEAIAFLQEKLSGKSRSKKSSKKKDYPWLRLGLVVLILFFLYTTWTSCRQAKSSGNAAPPQNNSANGIPTSSLLNNINEFLSGKGAAPKNSNNRASPTSRMLPGCTNCKNSRNRENISSKAARLNNALLQTERGDLSTLTKPSISDCNALVVLPREPLSDANINAIRALPKRKLQPVENKARRLRRTK